ncbi:MAG: S41 family peptidase, partial [Lachnospirales bacterium]
MNEFKKGVLYGVIICALGYFILNAGTICYRRFIAKDMAFDDKARLIYNTMVKEYTGDIDMDKMYEGIYAGMVYNTTDQYSRYISKDEYKNFMQQTEGNYCGMGAIISYNRDNETIEIEGVYDDSPAAKAGLMANDVIKKIDNINVTLETYYQAVDLVKGEEGTTFNITVYRPSTNETLSKTITRENIDSQTVAHSIINDDIGYLRITGFEEVTKNQFKENVDELKKEGVKYLIIDLRNNPGGLLTTVSEMADEFLDKGVLTYTENKEGKKNYIYSKDGKWNIPVVILVNKNSASASELFTGALKDYKIAKVVGETTFGKGVVQTTYPIY